MSDVSSIRPPTSTTETSSGRDNDQMVPRRRTLNGFAQEALSRPGMSLTQLDALSCLHVHTRNSLYQVTVLDPCESKVLIQGGEFFIEPTEAILCGSSFGGSLLRLRWIGEGMRMEISGGGLKVVTSPVQSLELRDEPPLAGPF